MGRKKTIDDEEALFQALLVISEIGPEKFTLADVGERVGLSPATLIQRFGSKDELLRKAAKQANKKLIEEVLTPDDKEQPPLQALLGILADLPEGFGTREDLANSLSILKLDMIDPDLHALAKKRFQLIRKRLAEIISEGQEKGSFREDLDPKSLAWELDALWHGFIIQWALSGTGTLAHWLRQKFTKYLEFRLKN